MAPRAADIFSAYLYSQAAERLTGATAANGGHSGCLLLVEVEEGGLWESEIDVIFAV